PSLASICPRSDAAPAAKVIVKPDKCSPIRTVVQLRAASRGRSGAMTFEDPADAGHEIDLRYQYFAMGRTLKRYCPGARLRKAKLPSLSGSVGVPSPHTNCGPSCGTVFSLCHGPITVSLG